MAVALAALAGLGGCGGPIVLQVLTGLASAATIADKVVGIDVSLTQDAPGKTPIVPATP